MRRLPDWPQRLWRAREARKASPLVWGALDCALYGADLVEAETGEDLARGFRGSYSDEAGARRIMAAHGWPDMAALLDAFLPRMERPRRGDVTLLSAGQSIGIVIDHRHAIGAGPTRPIILKFDPAGPFWKVG
jgi:hypothetical protein